MRPATKGAAARAAAVRAPPSIQSWTGFEDERAEIVALAHLIVAEDRRLAAAHADSAVWNGMVVAIKTPAIENDFATMGAAYRRLRVVTRELVHEHGLEFHFVRREYTVILNPAPSEIANCDRLVRHAARGARGVRADA